MGFPKGRAFQWQVAHQGPGSPRGSTSANGWNPQMISPLSLESSSSHRSQPSSPSSQTASSPSTPHGGSQPLTPASGSLCLPLQTKRCTTPFTARSPSTPASNVGGKLQGSQAATALQHRSAVIPHNSRTQQVSSRGKSGRSRGTAPVSPRTSVTGVTQIGRASCRERV